MATNRKRVPDEPKDRPAGSVGTRLGSMSMAMDNLERAGRELQGRLEVVLKGSRPKAEEEPAIDKEDDHICGLSSELGVMDRRLRNVTELLDDIVDRIDL